MNDKPIRVLLIEDDPDDVLLLKEALAETDRRRFYLTYADRLSAGLERLARGEFDVVLLDLNLPDSNGLDTLADLRAHAPHISIVILSGLADELTAVEAVRRGAQDYLVKGEVDSLLLGRVLRYAIERQQTQRALHESEERYRSLFDGVPTGLYRTTPAGQILDVNPTMVQMLGYPDRASLLAVNAAALYLSPEARRRMQTQMEQEEVVRGAEIQLRRRDGVVIWVRDTVRVVRAADGQVLYYQGSLEDITEQKRVAEAEREQRALIEALRDTAEALNRSLDPAEVLEHILANVGRVVRHDAANIMLIEQGIARVAHCQGYEERGSTVAGLQVALIDVPGFRQMMETGQPLLIPDINAYPNWIDLQKSQWQRSYIGVPIRAVDEVIGFLNLDSATPGFFTSTHVKHLEAFADQVAVAVTNARLYEDRRRQAARAEALARAASRLNTHLELEAVLDAICDETVHALNVPAASVTLYDEQNQVFHHVATLGLPAEYRERARPFPRALYDKFAAAQGRVVVALDAQALPEVPNADLYASLDIRTIVGASMWHEEQLIGGLNIFTFGTVRHFNADELALLMGLADQAALAIAHARLYASLQETNVRLFDALQAKDAMIQNVSHELRTPLTIISGYAELLTEGLLGTLGTEQAEAVQLICQQFGRLYFMVNRLLTLQTLDTRALDKVELDLQIFLQQTVKAWQARASAAKVQLRLEISDGLINLRADADLMGQVVENLLDNAMKFSPSGGLISVRAWAEESRVVIAIADQGIGLSAEQRARVFERFYQVDSSTRRRFGGAGIGLALCKAIVEAHAGRIWVESAGVGQGSTFYVALPIEG